MAGSRNTKGSDAKADVRGSTEASGERENVPGATEADKESENETGIVGTVILPDDNLLSQIAVARDYRIDWAGLLSQTPALPKESIILVRRWNLILLRAALTGCAEDEFVLVGDYPGHEIDATVQYRGGGSWLLTDYRYSDTNINRIITRAVTDDYSGRTEDVKKYYVIDGLDLSDSDVTYAESEIVIADISYPADELDTGEVEVVATLRLGGSDSYDYLTIKLQAIDNAEYGLEWRITDWWMEK